MLGRWAVWPVMSALALVLVWDTWFTDALLYVGLALTLGATAQYVAAGRSRRSARNHPQAQLENRLARCRATLAGRAPSLAKGSKRCMDTFPDLGALSDEELKDMIQELTEEEQEVSYRRRILHGKIDILRAELVNRLRKKHAEGESVISGADVQQLTDILSGKAIPEDPDAS